jgi:rRNA-processing protein FCF1
MTIENRNKTPNKKTYVLDTTVLIYDSDVIFKDGTADFVIPMAVIKELDGLKKSEDGNVARSARQVSRTLDRLSSYSELAQGVRLATGSILKVYSGYTAIDDLASDADNKIVGATIKLKKEVTNLVLCTTDNNMRVVARAHGIVAEPYLFGSGVSISQNVKGDANLYVHKEVNHMDDYRHEIEKLEPDYRGPMRRSFDRLERNGDLLVFIIGALLVILLILGYFWVPIAMGIAVVISAGIMLIMLIDRLIHPSAYYHLPSKRSRDDSLIACFLLLFFNKK